MSIKLIDSSGERPLSAEEESLRLYCLEKSLNLTFEWVGGQYWLHSDQAGERPIGLSIDQEIENHLQFFKKSSLHKDNLAKAVGIKGSYRPKVLDMTAGLLGDSLLLLSMGCQVMALERHPAVAFLIKSALKKAEHPLLKNFTFLEENAADYLRQQAVCSFDTLYYDPMFEDVNEKVLPKKEMRIFRSMVGSDTDVREVMELALALRPKRLVVKRPRLSKTIIESKPLQYLGKATRYDVYLSQNHGPNESNHLK